MSNETPSTRYLCQRCGNCCRWPGDVQVTSIGPEVSSPPVVSTGPVVPAVVPAVVPVVLPVVPVTVDAPMPPACDSLRGQPCRTYVPASNGG